VPSLLLCVRLERRTVDGQVSGVEALRPRLKAAVLADLDKNKEQVRP